MSKEPNYYLLGHSMEEARNLSNTNYWKFYSWDIGGSLRPYLRRWYLLPYSTVRWCNLYLHKFCRSDDERALHDHPSWSIGMILWGRYKEHLADGSIKIRRMFQPVYRNSTWKHRVELFKDAEGNELPVWTLFLMGKKTREWGFDCPSAWRHWQEFNKFGCE